MLWKYIAVIKGHVANISGIHFHPNTHKKKYQVYKVKDGLYVKHQEKSLSCGNKEGTDIDQTWLDKVKDYYKTYRKTDIYE